MADMIEEKIQEDTLEGTAMGTVKIASDVVGTIAGLAAAEVSGVAGGYMVGNNISLDDDSNVIDISVDAKYTYASFRFVLNNSTSDIVADEPVEIVMQANTNIHWMKIYNDGTNYVTATVTVVNEATGISEDYVVNVTFVNN